jgi:hypothetical protein
MPIKRRRPTNQKQQILILKKLGSLGDVVYMTAMKPQNSNAEILRAVLLGALLYLHDLSISISHNSYFSVPTKEKRQKSQAKTSQFILSCKSHEAKSIKLQKSNCRAFQTTC